MEISKKASQSIYIIKAFAVLSIICAHCCSVSAGHSVADLFASRILGSVGSAGVGMFLLLAGYLMHGTSRSFKSFFASKVTGIIVPWGFCGTLVYLYVYVRKDGLGLISLLKWLLGIDTYLYYLTVLFALFFLCYFVRRNRMVLFCYALISALSNLATGLGLLDDLNHYLNPFNFLIFFVIGVLLGEYQAFEKLLSFSKRVLPITVTGYIVLLLILAYNGIEVSYFILPFLPIEVLAILCVFGLSSALSAPPAIVNDIGKLSFTIYLLHMPFAGIIAAVFGKIDFWGLTLLRPITVLAITYVGIKLAVFVINKLPFKKVLNTLIGTR